MNALRSISNWLDTSKAAEHPDPDEATVRHGLEGNLCRCTGYQNIVRAVQDAAGRLRATAADDTPKTDAEKADTAGGVR